MSDEQEHPGKRSGAEHGRSAPDETREFTPFADDSRPAGRPGSADTGSADTEPADTGSGDTGSGEGTSTADATAQLPAAPGAAQPPDGTVLMPAVGDPTAGPPDGTSVLPADAATAARATARRAEPAWSGRAEVRPPRAPAGVDSTPTDWDGADWATPAPREPQSPWWMPVVIGIVVLVLLAVLGVGVWLIIQAGKDEPAAPAVTPRVAPASTSASSAAPSASPTPTTPSSAATTEPVDVAIPALVGLSSAEARRALDRVGLTYRLVYRPDDAPAETVIDCDPPEGRQVPADTEVILVIAAPRPSSAAATPSGLTASADEE